MVTVVSQDVGCSHDVAAHVNSSTVVYAVIGDPISHSYSPLMHNTALQTCMLNGVYAAFHVIPTQLEQAIAGIRALGIGGVNVTIPHKERVMAYLDEIDEHAKVIGAVNTIVQRHGKLYGYNTDGLGYVRSLKGDMQVHIPSARIVIIGAGGAARSIVHALLLEGCREIMISNRTLARAQALADDLSIFANRKVTALSAVQAVDPRAVDIVIQTTSVGMHPHAHVMPLAKEWLQPHMIVSDIVYNPLETELLKAAREAGCRTHNGLGMLAYQGAIAFEMWTGQPAPIESMRQKVLETLLVME